MIRLVVAGANTAISSTLCAQCPYSPAGCCTAPPRVDLSDIARIVIRGGRDWLIDEVAAGRLIRNGRALVVKRRKAVAGPDGPRIATCAYHGPQGCTIAHDRRPATCNYYVCEEALAEGGTEGARARDVHADLVETFTRWDAELARLIDQRWPEGAPFDAPFLDWLGATFREISNA